MYFQNGCTQMSPYSVIVLLGPVIKNLCCKVPQFKNQAKMLKLSWNATNMPKNHCANLWRITSLKRASWEADKITCFETVTTGGVAAAKSGEGVRSLVTMCLIQKNFERLGACVMLGTQGCCNPHDRCSVVHCSIVYRAVHCSWFELRALLCS